MKKIKPISDTYWDAEGVYDSTQGKTQKEINDATAAMLEAETLAGATVKFEAPLADMPLKELAVDIKPLQAAGTPAPEAPLPITGWTSCAIVRSGKNLLHATQPGQSMPYNGITMTVDNNGVASLTGTATGVFALNIGRFRFKGGVAYRLSGGPSISENISIRAHGPDAGTYDIRRTCTGEAGLKIEFETDTVLYIDIRISTGTNVTGITITPMIQLNADPDLAFEPFEGDNYTISFPTTVYGGALDIVNRKLHACPYYARYNGEALAGPWISSMDEYTPGSLPTIGAQVVDFGGEKTTIDLMTPEITTLYGGNTIWASCGDTSVSYGAYLETIKRFADPDCDVVQHSADLAFTNAEYVLVTHNDSEFGDGGPCMYQHLPGKTVSGYTRQKNERMYPLANQAHPSHATPNKLSLMHTIDSYLSENLPYGNSKTLYSSNCDGEIDCSSFISAVLQGVTYANSRYVRGRNAKNIIAETPADFLPRYSDAIGWERLLTWEMAQYFAERKQLFELPKDPVKAAASLQFGDILFNGSPSYAEKYYDISHVVFVLGTLPEHKAVIVCQAGSLSVPDNTFNLHDEQYNTSATNTAVFELTEEMLSKNIHVFARPHYPDSGNQELVIANEYSLFWLPYLSIDEETGRTTLDTSDSNGDYACRHFYVTPEFYPASPGSTLYFEFPDSYGFTVTVFEYGRAKEFLRAASVSDKEITLGNSTAYVRIQVEQTAEGIKTQRINELRVVYSPSLLILTQPVNTTAVAGNDVTFTIKTNRENATYIWQYYYQNNWVNFQGGTSASLTKTVAASWNGWKIRCIVEADRAQRISDEVTLTVTSE